MTYDALSFTLTSLHAGRLMGFGLVCVEARYCSVLPTGLASGFERCHVQPGLWKEIIQEIDVGFYFE